MKIFQTALKISVITMMLGVYQSVLSQPEYSPNEPLADMAASLPEAGHSDLYWVIETQEGEAPYTRVHFYDAEDREVHESRYEGIILDIQDRQTRLMIEELARFVRRGLKP